MTQKKYTGLSNSEVEESRAEHGSNILTPASKQSLWAQFLEKLSDPIIIILIVALALSLLVGAYQFFTKLEGAHVFLEPLGIFIAVSLATLVGFLFEVNANKKFEILNKVNDQSLVKVMREGVINQVPMSDIVVGDIVLLETGEQVPADGELIEAMSLQINESTLTGEPVSSKTIVSSEFNSEATYPSNYVLRGTSVVDGHGTVEITKVGDNTEYGKVYKGSQIDSSVKTPLNIQLDKLANMITRVSYLVAALIFVGRLTVFLTNLEVFSFLELGRFVLNTVMIAVTVIVVSVPEGLPMSVTLSLALSMQRMLKSNNLVRKMHACETMGATTVICTDKTGTLTQNKMQVYQTSFCGDNSDDILYEMIAVNSTAHLHITKGKSSKVIGNPTEGALLLWLEAKGQDYLSIRNSRDIISQLTFSTERKCMATVVKSKSEGKNIIYVKGAPEVVMAMSENVPKGIDDVLMGYQNMAMRTLGFGYALVDEGEECFFDGRIKQDIKINFVGIVAFSDPVREDVSDAILTCRNAGISVKVVTGDTSATTKEIARQIGLWTEADSEKNIITGLDFGDLTDEELLLRLDDIKIMSRARPMDKQRLVQLLQTKGEVVAVTGDGTNDAPALKAAQIGLSMGDGTSVAKEASDITILDNSFNSISDAVMWGRSLYKNIQRFILFQMTINVAACLVVLIGAFTGVDSPLTVTQMLWVNLIMDTFAALALASLPPSSAVMKDAPRKQKDYIISPQMAKMILGVGLIFVAVLLALVWYFRHTDIVSLCHLTAVTTKNFLSDYELSLFFTTFVMLQFWNMFNAKAFMSSSSALNFKGCRWFVITALIILFGQWAIVNFGGTMFNVVPISLSDWLIITISTSVVLLVGEAVRFFRKIMFNKV